MNSIQTLTELLSEYSEVLQVRYASTPGPVTGVAELDEYIRPLRPAKALVITAEVGHWHTTLALQIALRQASNGSRPAFMAAASTPLDIAERIVSLDGALEPSTLHSGRLSEHDWHRFGSTQARLNSVDLSIAAIDQAGRIGLLTDLAYNAAHATSAGRTMLIVDGLLDQMVDSRASGAGETLADLAYLVEASGVPWVFTTRAREADRPRFVDCCVVLDQEPGESTIAASVVSASGQPPVTVRLTRSRTWGWLHGVVECPHGMEVQAEGGARE